jgi:hypothetical protein
VKELPLETEGLLEELERVRNAGDVDDGVPELQGVMAFRLERGLCFVFLALRAEMVFLVLPNV